MECFLATMDVRSKMDCILNYIEQFALTAGHKANCFLIHFAMRVIFLVTCGEANDI